MRRNYVCKDYKIGFITIPKAASQSIIAYFDSNVDVISKKKFSKLDYFKFTFVRNPFDRVLSYYYNKIVAGIDMSFYNLGPTERSYLKRNDILESKNFDEFVERIYNKKCFDYNIHFRKQSSLLYYNEKLLVDFVGKIENIAEDFKVIQSRTSNKPLPRLNTSRHPSFNEVTSSISRDIIYEIYEEDFINFGYER